MQENGEQDITPSLGMRDGSNRNDLNKQVPPYESADVEDNGYPDGMIAEMALNKLDILSKQDTPFFLAVGFFKPHLPFNAPQKYWNLYVRENIPVSPFPAIPDQVHPSSLHNSGEFNQYALGDEKAALDHNVSDAYARKLKHAYAACVSYVDAQIGKLIQRLKETGMYENTIIVLWGDHGWHLGDHRVWGKHTLSEQSLTSTLIIITPHIQNGGQISNSPVASIDLYPTILDLCQIPMPHITDGKSLKPIILNPKISRKDPVYSFFRRGVSARTDQYRITKYFRQEEPTIELYDLIKDPGMSINIASSNPAIVNQLLKTTESNLINIYNQ